MTVVTADVIVIAAANALIGESPIWCARRGELLWIDILGQRLHRYDPTNGNSASRATPTLVGLLYRRTPTASAE